MLLTNFLGFTSFENVIIASSPLKDIFTGYRIQVHSSFIWAFEKDLPSGLPHFQCCRVHCFSAVGELPLLSHHFHDVFPVSSFQKFGYDLPLYTFYCLSCLRFAQHVASVYFCLLPNLGSSQAIISSNTLSALHIFSSSLTLKW